MYNLALWQCNEQNVVYMMRGEDDGDKKLPAKRSSEEGDKSLPASKKRESGGGEKDKDNEKFVDMFEAGIIDPKKVTRVAIENAVSVVGMILTTECMVVNKPEEKAPPLMIPPQMM